VYMYVYVTYITYIYIYKGTGFPYSLPRFWPRALYKQSAHR